MDASIENNRKLNEIPNFLFTALIDICSEQGIKKDLSTRITGTANKGDGYMGIIHFVELKGKSSENEEIVLNLVIKSANDSPSFRKMVPINLIFTRGIFVYEKINLEFQTILAEKLFPRFTGTAQHFKSSKENLKEFIVLENLKSKGYSM